MDATFLWKQQYREDVTWENLFFPWRSPMSTYDPLYEGKSRKYSLFWTEGRFGGKGRTPGERRPKCQEWTQSCSSKPLCPQHGLLSRNSFFKTQKFQKWPLFCHFFVRRIHLGEITWNKGHFWNFWVLKKEFLLNKPCWGHKGLEEHDWVHSWHFGHLSPGVRPFPQNPSIFQNNEYFRYLPSFRGSYVAKGERQGKNNYFFMTLSMYNVFRKKGACVHSHPVEKQKIPPKSLRRSWFKITTLIFQFFFWKIWKIQYIFKNYFLKNNIFFQNHENIFSDIIFEKIYVFHENFKKS